MLTSIFLLDFHHYHQCQYFFFTSYARVRFQMTDVGPILLERLPASALLPRRFRIAMAMFAC